MAWIKTVDESEAQGDVKEHYESYAARVGFVPGIHKIYNQARAAEGLPRFFALGDVRGDGPGASPGGDAGGDDLRPPEV